MTMPIGNVLKGLSVAAILLAVPAFAVFGLMANTSHRSSVELSAEHDPLQNGFRFAEKAKPASGNAAATTDQESELPDWRFTIKPVPSPTPAGYTFP
jgi:hypothetical protein